MTRINSNRMDLTGQIFTRLKVIKEVEKPAHLKTNGGRYWLCKCDCSTEAIVYQGRLRDGTSKSCGCLAKERRIAGCTKHGRVGTREYYSWNNMRNRCNNPKFAQYKDYGGRGINVCKQWDSFNVFYKDMGTRPEGTSIDRIDNDGNYEPQNCKWSTPKEQMSNRRV